LFCGGRIACRLVCEAIFCPVSLLRVDRDATSGRRATRKHACACIEVSVERTSDSIPPLLSFVALRSPFQHVARERSRRTGRLSPPARRQRLLPWARCFFLQRGSPASIAVGVSGLCCSMLGVRRAGSRRPRYRCAAIRVRPIQALYRTKKRAIPVSSFLASAVWQAPPAPRHSARSTSTGRSRVTGGGEARSPATSAGGRQRQRPRPRGVNALIIQHHDRCLRRAEARHRRRPGCAPRKDGGGSRPFPRAPYGTQRRSCRRVASSESVHEQLSEPTLLALIGGLDVSVDRGRAHARWSA